MFYFEDTRLSNSYILGDLTKTSQILALPNSPDDQTEKWIFANLILLAQVLEYLEQQIGPFVIISGFRTAELQAALKNEGAPVGSGTTKSFHEVGRAVDIYPSTMSIDDYFGKMLANEEIRTMFAEISIKPSQNSLHLAINVPGDARAPKILGLNSENKYVNLTSAEIQNYISKYSTAPEVLSETLVAEAGMSGKMILGMIAAAAASLIALVS